MSTVSPVTLARSWASDRSEADVSNERLLARFNDGDHEAWSVLVGRFERLVYAVALSSGLGHHDAADVAQSTFAALLRHSDRIRRPERLGSWLTTVARRLTWRTIEQRRRELPLSHTHDLDRNVDFDRSLDLDLRVDFDQTDRFVRDAEVYDAVRQLPPGCRDMIDRLYLDGSEPTYAELSVALDRPLGSIGPVRQRCLSHLRLILEAMQT